MKHLTAQIKYGLECFTFAANIIGPKQKTKNTGTQRMQNQWRFKMPWLFAKIEKQRVFFAYYCYDFNAFILDFLFIINHSLVFLAGISASSMD